ncbi:MAG: hypothetical protein ACYC64_18810 [Armatimonadota bacterium]
MKYLARISACSCCSFALSQPLWAHGDAEELGHHWESHAYIGEMHFQFIVMAALAIIIVAGTSISRMRKRRSASR